MATTEAPATMTAADAFQLARDWVAARKEVRAHLIELARQANPVTAERWARIVRPGNRNRQDNAVRKLYAYPADLSEVRLLALIADGTASRDLTVLENLA